MLKMFISLIIMLKLRNNVSYIMNVLGAKCSYAHLTRTLSSPVSHTSNILHNFSLLSPGECKKLSITRFQHSSADTASHRRLRNIQYIIIYIHILVILLE